MKKVIHIRDYKRNVVVVNKILEYQKTGDMSVFFDLKRSEFKEIRNEIRFFKCGCRKTNIQLCHLDLHIKTEPHKKYLQRKIHMEQYYLKKKEE